MAAGGGGGGFPPARWCFSRQQLDDSPSRRGGGLDRDRELSYRQQAANLLQDMGQRLNVSQLTINTAIVYMHRFYMLQCFTKFHRNNIAPAALFLAAKVEEQPRKLEHVIKVAHACLNPQEPSPDAKSDAYLQQAQDLVILESVILQTLGFDITIDHPHTHVVKCTQLVRASKDLAQTSYFMATNSLHLTTFCLQYPPPVVACVCIHLACKWSNWEIPVSTDGKNWWEYVDPTVTLELLDGLTHEFLQILEKTPNRLKRIKNWRACQAAKKPRLDGQEEGLSAGHLAPPSSADSAFSELMSIVASSVSGGGGPHQPGSSRTWPQLEGEESGEVAAKRNGGGKHPPAAGPLRVSLSEYRAKHAAELASQKRKLESLEASVREEYASAAQALLEQQKERDRRPRDSHQPVPIRIRLPAAGRQAADAGEDQLRVRIKVPAEEAGVSRSRHSGPREKRREQASNHHRHRHHHHHHHHGRSARRDDLSRRPSREDDAGHHRPPQRPGKSAKAAVAPHPPSSSAAAASRFNAGGILDLPFPPSGGLTDKEANGHEGPGPPSSSEHSHYQDTFDMLESLLSAQGMPPVSQPRLNFLPAPPGSRVPPPLPAEPPPPLPPLPK
ncbi:cyclin-T1-like isoform X2 [Scyliorhinus torazame]|uniref:cyclin-T1-like isoform X2 n=1 Tax=Scyliorhinus torazame TaxID=75743 RepID=UPI003B59EFE1